MSDWIVRSPAKTGGASLQKRAAVALLERGGWELIQADIDMIAGTARVVVRSFGRRWVTLHADGFGRRCYVERQAEVLRPVKIGAGGLPCSGGGRGDSIPGERSEWFLLGRDHTEGIRSGARFLAAYLADNSDGQLSLADARRAFGGLLTEATKRAEIAAPLAEDSNA